MPISAIGLHDKNKNAGPLLPSYGRYTYIDTKRSQPIPTVSLAVTKICQVFVTLDDGWLLRTVHLST